MRSAYGRLRTHIWNWGKPMLPSPRRIPSRWYGSCGRGRGCQCSHPPSMGRSYGIRNGGINSSYITASFPLTYHNIVNDVERHLTSAVPSTPRREASLRHVATISAMGLPTLRERPSPPHTCLTNPTSTQVILFMEGRTI